jgi:hypothetical protein
MPAALRGNGEFCANCHSDRTKPERPKSICFNCGIYAHFDMHHIQGRKISPTVKPICLNCHARMHRRKYG